MPEHTKAQLKFLKDLEDANGYLKLYDLHEKQVAEALERKGKIVIVGNISQYKEISNAGSK